MAGFIEPLRRADAGGGAGDCGKKCAGEKKNIWMDDDPYL
jgi:hypothetical protein